MSQEHLVELEQQALKFRNSGKVKEAAELFLKIVNEFPNFEFGICYYDLANCYEELGELEKARENYIKAIEFDDQDETRWSGYASFLYLHGTPEEALEAYLHLFKLNSHYGFNTDKILSGIKNIGKKLGYSEQKIKELTDKI